MPFVASTSKQPTAVLGAVSGFFLGKDESLVLLNRLNLLSLYSETDDSLEHLSDFALFASLKYMEALPLFDSKGSGRHVVFLFSIKQEVAIVAFERNGAGTIEMVTLFHGDVDTCFYQERPDKTFLCCSGVYQTLHDDLLPVVTFSIHNGSVFLFDVAAAIAAYGGKCKNASHLLNTLFSPEYAQNVLRKQKKQTLFTQGHLSAAELDVRSMAFGPNHSEKNTAALYLLYADASSKAHVSEYSIELGMNAGQGSAQTKPAWPWLPDTVGISPRGDIFTRRTVFLANVETNACLLHVNADGLFVLGPQLITFVSLKTVVTPSTLSKHVTTLAFPPFSAYVEPVCCASLPTRDLLILFWDGSCIKTSVKEEAESLNPSKIVLVNFTMPSLRTIPNSLVLLPRGHCVVGSRMTHTLWLKWFTGERGVLLENCGPMFDLTVAVDGPRISVVASTGVGLSGGLSLQRSAVNICQDASMVNLSDVTRVCAAGDAIILSFPGYSRVCQCQTTPTVIVQELSETPFDSANETLTLVYDPERDTFVQVTSVGVNVVKGGHGEYIFRNDEVSIHHAHANADLGLLVFSSARFVSVLDVTTLLLKASIELENEVACLAITSLYSFVVGEWNSGAVCLYDVQDGHIVLKGRTLCSATPCSVCVLSQLHTSRLVVGLLNGCIAEIPLEAMSMGGAAQETLIRMQPVQLFNLESHNAVLCLGEVPLIAILCDTGFQLTGVDFNDVAACAVIDNPRIASKYMFFSRSEKTLVFGNIVDLKN
ncbi:putative damage-specific DNA binding protein [Trypanosoma conorhini]|uniref:Putative damage-specific DNA binding protein n=1 Tax=Trypanosoma conorhini TaxID=83891 RepID=A0A3R7N0C3_9TRYP|nr:putative damage-specific DNA binding protein [Trypanosoma conorhini]RNF10798.1 putative damage-specific DNA binding protein [Trypanosoma conorhini]